MMNYDFSKMSNTMILDEIDRVMEAGEDMDAEAVSYLLGVLQERTPVMIGFDVERFLEKSLHKLRLLEEQGLLDDFTSGTILQ